MLNYDRIIQGFAIAIMVISLTGIAYFSPVLDAQRKAEKLVATWGEVDEQALPAGVAVRISLNAGATYACDDAADWPFDLANVRAAVTVEGDGAVLDGGAIATFGGHKGAGLALCVELLAGALSGGAVVGNTVSAVVGVAAWKLFGATMQLPALAACAPPPAPSRRASAGRRRAARR